MELPQVISSSRLRRRLYQTLRDKGVIQELKTNLRHKLISEFCASNVRPSLPPTEVDHLQKRLYEGIIADYLSNRGYMYTLSVFIPEMGLQTAQVYSRDEILKFLKLSDTPRLTQFQRRRLFDSEIPLLDVLVQFLEEIYGRSLQNIGIQAGSETGVSFYESQLQRIDQKFQSKHLLDIETTRAAFEDRIRHCRYEIETELQRSFSEKLENFKKLRLEEMRQEVEANMSEQFSAKQQQLEALHAAERARLDEREKHLNELAQKSREVSERTAFLQRQALEAEIQAARAQTEKARAMESELERQRRQMQEDFERQRMQLDMERNNLLEKKQSFDDIVRQEVERLRKTDELDLLRQRKNLEVAEARILVEKDALDAQKKVVLAAQDEASRKLELFSEMEIADYKSLKLKATAAANEVNLLQSRLAQAFEEIERLKEASADAASERNVLMASRQETERLRSCLDRERSNSNNERMKLQLEIDQLTGENQRLKERVRLQENELSRLRGRLADLRSAPTDSGQLKQKRTNEQSWTTESVKNVVKESPVSSQETAGTKPDANFQGDAVDNRGGILNSQPSAAFLAARERLESLERESRELEKAYSEWRNCSTYTKVENSASSARPPQHAKLSNSLSAAFFTGLKSTSIPTLRPFTTQWPLPYMRSLSSVVDVAREPLPKTILETRFLSSNLPNLGDYAELSGPEAKNNEKPGEMNFQQSITKPNPRPVSAVGATNSVSRPSDCSHQLAVETDVGNGLTSKLEDHHFSAKCHADGKPSSMSEQQNVSPLSAKPASSIYPAGDEVHASALKFRPEERPVESSSGATVFPPIKELLNQKEPLLEINNPPSGPKRSERFSSPEVISDNQEAGHEQQQQLQQEMVEDAKQNYLPADDNDEDDDGELTSESSQEADLADENSDAAIDPMILKYMAIVKEQQKSLQKQLQQQKESGEGRGLDHGKSFNQQEHPVNATKPTFEDFLTNDQFESDRSARNESVLAPQPASKAADDQSEEKDNSEDFW